MKIATIIGARPQFIKAALLSERIRKDKSGDKKITEILINTGQHYDYNMSKMFFEELNIPKPDYNLNVRAGPYASQMAKMMQGIEAIVKKEKPDAILVYGDTNSTLAGSLVAVMLNIPLYHIEAGLRSYDKSMPEEINRLIADNLSTLLFCPTDRAVKNLRKENIRKGVYLVGDIMYELAMKTEKAASKESDILRRFKIRPKKYILATVHRQASTDIKSNLRSIVKAFCRMRNVVVFPVHPRTQKMLKKFGLWKLLKKSKNVKIIPPIGYIDMICIEKNASKIITDSGGVQKEAYFFKVPCITLRDNTEWAETLHGGWNSVVGTGADKIVKAVQRDVKEKPWLNYYGTGRTSGQILNILKKMKA